MKLGVTVPERLPDVVRAVRNGNQKGMGLRLYVPTQLTHDLGLAPGQFYRMNRRLDGRIMLRPVEPDLSEDVQRPGEEGHQPRIRPELTQREATALEAALTVGDTSQRGILLDIAKRLRRRMRKAGWPTPNRGEDHLEAVEPRRVDLLNALADAFHRDAPAVPDSPWCLDLIEQQLAQERAV